MVYVELHFWSSEWLWSDTIVQGSYAGARAAHMRVLYPELVYGAIASSGPSNLFILQTLP